MSENTAPYLFRDPSLWLGRLKNILTAIDETIDQTDMQIQVREKVSGATNMFEFQLMQIKSLKSMLEHMKGFGEEILVKCTAAVVKQEGNPRLDLLRTAFHELTTDLNLVQRALNQRLWAVKLSVDQEKASQKTNKRLVEDLKKWLKEEIAQADNTQGGEGTQKKGQSGKKQQKSKWSLNMGNDAIQAAAGLGGAVAVDSAIDTLFDHEAFEFVGSKIASVLDVEVRSKQTQTLIYADILANYALLPAQSLIQQSDDPVEVVTYFTENNVSVRILPYYPDIILVGLPYSAGFLAPDGLSNLSEFLEEKSKKELDASARLPWEFLSLPHEVGHYLFWNGVVKGAGSNGEEGIEEFLRDRLEKNHNIANTQWQYHWLEEIFADTFKSILLGPIAVLGLQAMLSDAADQSQLFHDNGYHPISAIRPLIASYIVEKLYPKQYSDVLSILDENWKKFLKKWDFDADGQGEESKITIGKDASKNVKGQWTNHMHRDQPGMKLEWGKKVPLLYREIEAGLDKVIEETQDVLKTVTGFKHPKNPEKSKLTRLTFKGKKLKAPLFPIPKEFNESKTIDDLVNSLFDHLEPRLTDFGVPASSKREDGKAAEKQEALITQRYQNELSYLEKTYQNAQLEPDLVKALEEFYNANWGDKGPRGGNIGS